MDIEYQIIAGAHGFMVTAAPSKQPLGSVSSVRLYNSRGVLVRVCVWTARDVPAVRAAVRCERDVLVAAGVHTTSAVCVI